MAGGCGCTQSCDCLVRGITPVRTVGNGSVARPYEVGMAYGGETGPQAVTACVADQLGLGLTYDRGSKLIQAHLSEEEGNLLRFGANGGLLVTGTPGPAPETCGQVTVDTLPAAPNVVGADALAGLMNPYSAPYGVDYCLNQRFHILGCIASATADDVAWVAEYTDGIVSRDRSTIQVSYYARALPADAIATTQSTAGDLRDPAVGWYGWMARTYDNWFLPQLLDKVAGRAVVLVNCTVPIPEEGAPPVAVAEEHNVFATTRAVLQGCAQAWTLVGVRELVSATSLINAGLLPIMIADYPDADGKPTGSRAKGRWGPTGLPYTVDELQAVGVQWLLLDRYYADSVFTTYAEAGFHVLMYGATRHSDSDRVARLGIRGGHALDPLYYRKGAGSYDYRAQLDPWTVRRPGTGQLTHMTDRRLVTASGGRIGGVRGYCQGADQADQGLIIPPGFGEGYGRPCILIGWEGPLTNPQEYYIDFQMMVPSLGDGASSIQKIGLLFGAETDEDLYAWPEDPEVNPEGFPAVPPLAYRAFQRTTGEIGLAKWDRATGTFIRLTEEVETPALEVNTWVQYRVQVNQNGVALIRWLPDGTQRYVQALDQDYRGDYFHFEKEEGLAGLDDPATRPFSVKMKNIFYNEGSPNSAQSVLR